MAARLNKRTADQSRSAIKTTQLIKRLQDHILEGLDLKASQVDAAKYLINQALGTARQSVQHTGGDGGPITYAVERTIVDPASQDTDTESTRVTH